MLTDAGIEFTHEGIEVMAHAREIKSRDEIECIRMVCAISEATLSKVKKAIAPGVRESDLVKNTNEAAYEHGGTSFGDAFVSLSGPNPEGIKKPV